MTEAGMRKVFRLHGSGPEPPGSDPTGCVTPMAPNWPTTGIDLLVLRELMGHARPETTAAYVHVSPETLAAGYAQPGGHDDRSEVAPSEATTT